MSAVNSTAHVKYRTIADQDGYRFGDDGTVQSCWAGIGHNARKTDQWRNLALVINSAGYYVISMKRRGKYRATFVHHLIAEAFLGPRPDGKLVCHRDGDPINNRPTNLRYSTQQENEDDKKIHRTRPQGSQVATAKLNEGKVRAIWRLRLVAGQSIVRIAKRYGVHHSIISDIINGKTWKHV